LVQGRQLNVLPLPSLEPTEMAMLPPEPDADEPLPMLTSPLVPTDALPVLKDKSPDTPELPALLVDTDTLPELVSVPTPDEIVMDPPKADVPSPPSIATAPPLVLPSPEARVKLPPAAPDDDPAIIEAWLLSSWRRGDPTAALTATADGTARNCMRFSPC